MNIDSLCGMDRSPSVRAVKLSGPSGPLDAVWHEPGGHATPRFASVVAHPHPLYGGTKENAVVLATTEALHSAGGGVLRFDFRGVGRSAGRHDGGAGEVDDLHAAEHAARELAGGVPLVVAGYSFGAVMALRRLQRGAVDDDQARPDAVLAIAPPIEHYDFSFLRDNATPLVVLCGGRDALTPRDLLERQARSWGTVLDVGWLDQAGHDLDALARPEALLQRLEKSIATLLGALSSAPEPTAQPRT
jgi:alpha/beta superfamily hydrolase